MIRTFFILVLLATTLKTINMSAQNPPSQDANSELISLVEQTFAQGALNKMEIEQMRKGFHPAFAILIPKGNEVLKLPLDAWIKIVQAYKDSPEKLNSGIRNLHYTIAVLDRTDCTAVVKTEFFRNQELIITDYLLYSKFDDTWKAVSKISKEYSTNPLHLDL
ncbi:nuclear transport factor 2 family protein [Myroides sp. 1354]|uniref:nuclear transport factor 2 family protein n=2 Tax=Myroides TaxID=76831 RepID=UPI002576E110|nr:nuclear transport factor 2 family protein [Myroides sp. R163-1]MDM1044849.1 nuclear transport factor 2 family protein [Myroides sp. R163-1]MDM1055562.1 nuclear transport factor 2 family protein [Myroides sp. 1354]MDM1068859.1 nuclear transport factor 2 family protein [Myroides sp. 1372]